jgi:broad specificity phosphatase PhoE
VHVSAVYSGALTRQRETAREAFGAFVKAGMRAPEIQTDPRWNEFDLDAVYRVVAPRLHEDDAEFRTEHEKLLQLLAQENSPAHRTWTLADTLVVRAWVTGRYDVPGESWQAFRERVSSAVDALNGFASGESVAVFSSATPIAVWVGMALALDGRHVMRLAGVTYNTALTTMRVRAGDLALYSFNGTPHLPEPHLRTFR